MYKKLNMLLVLSFILGIGYAQRQFEIQKVKTAPESSHARVIFVADSVNAHSAIGYQMFLDPKARAVDSFMTGSGSYRSLNYSISSPRSAEDTLIREGFYDYFNIKLPADASCDFSAQQYLFKATDSVDIEAGVYDFITVSLSPYGYINPNRGDFSFGDNFSFEGGYTYIFKMKPENQGNIAVSFPIQAKINAILLPSPHHQMGEENIRIEIANLGNQAISNFQVGYRVNGQDGVEETCAEEIAPNSTYTYTFTVPYDMSEYTTYTCKSWIKLNGNAENQDSVTATTSHIQPLSIPYLESFNTSDALSDWFQANYTIGNSSSYYSWNVSTYTEGADPDKTMGCLQSPSYGTDPNLYLISYPIQLKAGDNHVIFYYEGGTESQPEHLELLCGNSSDVFSMEKINEINCTNKAVTPPYPIVRQWTSLITNINVATDSVVYFALHFNTTGSTSGVLIDEFSVNPGKYDLLPDLALIEALVPTPRCGLTSTESIGVKIQNKGKVSITDYSLAYQINDGEWISEEFTEEIQPEGTKEIYFSQTVDFSEKEKTYSFRFIGTCTDDNNLSNDSIEGATYHLATIATLPYRIDFWEDSIFGWYSPSPDDWYKNRLGYTARKTSVKLFSPFFQLENKTYKITLDYVAGKSGVYGSYTPEDFCLLGGSTATPFEDWDTIKVFKNIYTANQIHSFDTLLILDKATEYNFAIASDQTQNLRIAIFQLENTREHAMEIINISSNLSAVVPAKHANLHNRFDIEAMSHGILATKDIYAEVYRGDELLFSTDSATLNYKETAHLHGSFKNIYPAYTSLELSAKMRYEGQPAEEDTRFVHNIYLSDSCFATDTMSKITSSLQDYIVAVGNVYTLNRKDTLTSITIGHREVQVQDTIVIGVAKVETDENGTLSITEKIGESSFIRGTEAGFFSTNFELELEAGAYYFYAVYNSQSSRLATDNVASGSYYTSYTLEGDLIQTTGNNIALRANFSKHIVEKPACIDIQIVEISKPAEEGVFSDREEIEVMVLNPSDIPAKDVKVSCSIDGTELESGAQVLDVESNTAELVLFTGDLSKVGEHSILIKVEYEFDTILENNQMTKKVICLDTTVANEDPIAASFRDYPNPARETWTIESNREKIQQVSLYNNAGVLVRKWNVNDMKTSVYVADLPKGIYFALIATEQHIFKKKLIVQ